MRAIGFIILTLLTLTTRAALNSPYPSSDKTKNYAYSAFAEQPKHLDPAKAYSSDEYSFIGQIYEPILQYHYLKRPYQLTPLTAEAMPTVTYYDRSDQVLPKDVDPKQIAYSVYHIRIKPGIHYQPHPAFAKDAQGNYRYHNLSEEDVADIYNPKDFAKLDTRELVADDYIFQIKRLADPKLSSPILSLMVEQIVGLKAFAKRLRAGEGTLQNLDIDGVRKIDSQNYEILTIGKNPQFMYWLAMPFFSPMPIEAVQFYEQDVLKEKNMTLDWFPVGTGPYYLEENNPNRYMVLNRNPNFNHEYYPSEGMPEDASNGLLDSRGQPLPFIDKAVFSLEKESIPRWSKFLQGYYDRSGIASDNFDQAIQMAGTGSMHLQQSLTDKGIQLQTAIAPTIMYYGFNMLDPVVGGESSRAKKLRQAISIAIDMEEYITIFMNGRGIAAQGPIPPGIFGFQSDAEAFNHQIYQAPQLRHDINIAKQLLVEAGYPGGIDQKTGKPLTLNYDVIARGGPDDKALMNWMIKQFAKLNIVLNIRGTQYNRFREKMSNGTAQFFGWGWNADYPDPENFLFLFYSGNGKVKHGGENAANYHNAQFDQYFEQMKNMDNTPARKAIIEKMLSLLQEEAPWVWGVHPKTFILSHDWNTMGKPNQMANNGLKYQKIDTERRAQKRDAWNKPVLWPLGLGGGFMLMFIGPVWLSYRAREKGKPQNWLEDND